jgi:hypothetical protein
MIVSSPHNRRYRHVDSTIMKIICAHKKKFEPKVNVDLEPNGTPLKNLGQQQVNQWLKGPSKNQHSRGYEVPIRFASKSMRSSYDELCETTLNRNRYHEWTSSLGTIGTSHL